jgi:two-component system, OmpR family, sensor histidine kinase CpxA
VKEAMIRSIYAKIFLWFWVVALGAVAVVMLFTNLSGSYSRASLWMSLAGGVYARGSVDIYRNNGRAALAEYMSQVEGSHGIRATLLDPQNQDILGKGVPHDSTDIIREARETGQNQFRGGIVYTGASPVSTPQGTFVLVAQVHPWQVFENPALLGRMTLKFLVALLCTGFLCLIFARHIASPIRTLQSAAARIADGDLSVRAMPAIAPRSDELAKLARDFDRMAERIQDLLHKQRELLGDISHELRSPLTRLNVSLELLRHGDGDAIERMQTDINRLDELIGQVLTLTRLQMGEGQKVMTSVNLQSIVESVAEDARFEGQRDGKSVVVTHVETCLLAADPALLRSCIENVVRNAIRHTRQNTEVVISLDKVTIAVAPWAQITVTDHGNGVPRQSMSRLFEPFYRVSETGNSGANGFGLGLAIAQRVAFLYGGNITARNLDIGGLEMKIILPLKDSVQQPVFVEASGTEPVRN